MKPSTSPETPYQHSPLGASNAKRWLLCPGSYARWQFFDDCVPVAEELPAEWRDEGTAVHEISSRALKNNQDAWEFAKIVTSNGVAVTDEMARRAQVFLDECNRVRQEVPDYGPEALVEQKLFGPNPAFEYGTLDFALVPPVDRQGTAYLRDYKDGAGVFVASEGNEQLLYYAFLLVFNFPSVVAVDAAIVQPRLQGISRVVWSTEFLKDWYSKVLGPGIARAQWDTTLNPGAHCQFCPRRDRCPMLGGLVEAAARDMRTISGLDDDAVDREYALLKPARIRLKAIEDEVYRRAMTGTKFLNAKLVEKRSDRQWLATAEPAAIVRWGPEALTTPDLLSPAQLEKKFGTLGEKFAEEFAFQPKTGYSVAPADDRRKEADPVKETQERYNG